MELFLSIVAGIITTIIGSIWGYKKGCKNARHDYAVNIAWTTSVEHDFALALEQIFLCSCLCAYEPESQNTRDKVAVAIKFFERFIDERKEALRRGKKEKARYYPAPSDNSGTKTGC